MVDSKNHFGFGNFGGSCHSFSLIAGDKEIIVICLYNIWKGFLWDGFVFSNNPLRLFILLGMARRKI
ncbi:MAG: hypothetical protein D6732_09120 [Methanobacteriota archaeon]|nr:MAG: hypothetical protein D6732_09120 [Euryarchaeota archaeon]